MTLNKTQVLCAVGGLLLVLAVVAIYHGRHHTNVFILAQTRTIGAELLADTNSSKLIRIGPALNQQLTHLLASASAIEAVRLGDVPIGNGEACSHVILSNASGKRLGIRFRQDSDPEKFHVLGFWNLGK